MFERIIRFAIEQRWLVLLAVLAMAGLGIYNYQRLPIDAVPDITNVQVQINTQASGYSPLETEQRVTYPIETVMAGLPNLEQTRSLSRYGLSQVTVVFKDGTDIYFARQLVGERIQQARDSLPAGITPTLGPISTGLGEIYLWTVEAEDGAKKPDAPLPMDLREIQDWVIKPSCATCPASPRSTPSAATPRSTWWRPRPSWPPTASRWPTSSPPCSATTPTWAPATSSARASST